MSIKNVLLQADNSDNFAARLKYAIAFAEQHEAHLTALYVVPDFPIPAYVGMPMDPGVINQNNDFEWAEANRSKAIFDDAMTNSNCPFEWRVEEGDPVRYFNLHGRYFDLAVTGQTDPTWRTDLFTGITDDLVIGLGRPCLVVPFQYERDRPATRILVAWDASHAAARAINDAISLLQAAEKVDVISINPDKTELDEGDIASADICLHLARHGVTAQAQGLHARNLSKGEVILTHCNEIAADLLVMGAYGHSRIREFILGGTTRYVLNRMDIPAFMSH